MDFEGHDDECMDGQVFSIKKEEDFKIEYK